MNIYLTGMLTIDKSGEIFLLMQMMQQLNRPNKIHLSLNSTYRITPLGIYCVGK